MIELRKIDRSNIWAIVKLSVQEDQRNFVATNTESLLEAYLAPAEGCLALPFGIYHDEEPVGFVMFGYGTTGDSEEPTVAKGNYCLWRFMIDGAHQRHGYGKEALAAALAYLRTGPCGAAEHCWLSYEPDNFVARHLYHTAGFRENGELCGNEIVSVLRL